jgi:hypothetical protein
MLRWYHDDKDEGEVAVIRYVTSESAGHIHIYHISISINHNLINQKVFMSSLIVSICIHLFLPSIVDVRDFTTDSNLMKEASFCFEVETPDRVLRLGADSNSDKVCMYVFMYVGVVFNCVDE